METIYATIPPYFFALGSGKGCWLALTIFTYASEFLLVFTSTGLRLFSAKREILLVCLRGLEEQATGETRELWSL